MQFSSTLISYTDITPDVNSSHLPNMEQNKDIEHDSSNMDSISSFLAVAKEMSIKEHHQDDKQDGSIIGYISECIEVLKEEVTINEEHDKVEKPSEKHFRAIEVPDHVRENRYEKLVKHQEKKRKKAKEEAKKDLEKKIQPFSFVEREE